MNKPHILYEYDKYVKKYKKYLWSKYNCFNSTW